MTGRALVNRPTLRPSERSVLHFLRLSGALSKAELARLSDMSAQGISVIVDRLLDLGLVAKGPKQRGRVGQPSTPIVLHAQGATSVGIFVERNKVELCAVDFTGNTIAEDRMSFDDISCPKLCEQVFDMVTNTIADLTPHDRKRLVGIGIAASEAHFSRFCGGGLKADPTGSFKMSDLLEKRHKLPVYGINDIRAACLAELDLGGAWEEPNTLYFNVGHHLGSGIILEGRLIGEEDKLSSGLYSLPLPGKEIGGKMGCVMDFASVSRLEDTITGAGYDFAEQVEADYRDTREQFHMWCEGASFALSSAISTACATISIDRVLIEGQLPRAHLNKLIEAVKWKVNTNAINGSETLRVDAGTFGSRSSVLGAAMFPFHKNFGPEQKDGIQKLAKSIAA